MKKKFEKALKTAEPASPKLLSHVISRRRVIGPSASLCLSFPLGASFGSTAISIRLLWFVDHFLQIRPEDLVLRVFQVMEIAAFHRKNKHARGAEAHHQAGQQSYPSEIHSASREPSAARDAML